MTFREFRRQRGLTLEAIAVLGGVDAATVSRFERGLVQPQPETIVRIARALGVSAKRLESMVPHAQQAEPAAAAL